MSEWSLGATKQQQAGRIGQVRSQRFQGIAFVELDRIGQPGLGKIARSSTRETGFL